jgi:cysteine synthase A
VIFGQPPKKRHIPGIGSSITPVFLRDSFIDDVMIVSESDATAACWELLEQHGLFVGGSTGSVYSAIQTFFRRHVPVGRTPKVLFLCCDRGIAYLHTVFNREWDAGAPVEAVTKVTAMGGGR